MVTCIPCCPACRCHRKLDLESVSDKRKICKWLLVLTMLPHADVTLPAVILLRYPVFDFWAYFDNQIRFLFDKMS